MNIWDSKFRQAFDHCCERACPIGPGLRICFTLDDVGIFRNTFCRVANVRDAIPSDYHGHYWACWRTVASITVTSDMARTFLWGSCFNDAVGKANENQEQSYIEIVFISVAFDALGSAGCACYW
jgi:hypothetical protein